MSSLPTIRLATRDDLQTILALIDGYSQGHPAEHYERPPSAIKEAYFGNSSLSRMLIAEKDDGPVGFGAWRRVFDLYWALEGGEIEGLYVTQPYRGSGIAAQIIAAVCADIRNEGGCFLRGTYTDEVAHLYERVAVGHSQRECHLSAAAFQTVANLAGSGPRELVRALPAMQSNRKM